MGVEHPLVGHENRHDVQSRHDRGNVGKLKCKEGIEEWIFPSWLDVALAYFCEAGLDGPHGLEGASLKGQEVVAVCC